MWHHLKEARKVAQKSFAYCCKIIISNDQNYHQCLSFTRQNICYSTFLNYVSTNGPLIGSYHLVSISFQSSQVDHSQFFGLMGKFVFHTSEAFKWWAGSSIVVGWFIAANKMYCPPFPILDIGLIGLHSLYWFLLDFMEFYSRQDGKLKEAYMAIKQMIAWRREFYEILEDPYDILCLNCVCPDH